MLTLSFFGIFCSWLFFVWFSVLAHLITWKDSSLKWPVVCQIRHQILLPSTVWSLVGNTPVRRSGMARVLKGFYSFTRIHPLTVWGIPKLVFLYGPRRDGRLS